MGFLKNLAIGVSIFAIGGCIYNKDSEELFPKNNDNLEKLLEMREELENDRLDAIQKITNNVVQIEVLAKRKQTFLTKKELSKQIKGKVLKKINSFYEGNKLETIVDNILSKILKDINMQVAFSNVKGEFELAGTGFIYKTCKGDVLLTNYHVLFNNKQSYQTPYSKVMVDTTLKNKLVFYNREKINLDTLIILKEPRLDLIITKLPSKFNKQTYRVNLADPEDVRPGLEVIKMGNTFGEGIQISSGVISYNGTKEKIILERNIEIRLLSLPVSHGDSGGPVLSKRNLEFIGTIVGMDPVKDTFSVPMRAYILSWKQSIGKLKQIEPYDECFYD